MSVPVLLEQITLIDPSVSTVFNDLHIILFQRMMFAVIVKDTVNVIGRPLGTKVMATQTAVKLLGQRFDMAASNITTDI